MRAAQFVKGMINGVEDFYESPNILTLLPYEKLQLLMENTKLGFTQKIFLKDYVIALSTVKKAEADSLGRDGLINHTVIYKFDEVITHDGAVYRIDPEAFKEAAYNGAFRFTMPAFPELKRPLDPPPNPQVNQP